MFDTVAFPAHPKSEAFVDQLFELLAARDALSTAKAKVPEYTAQHDSRDYYADEQERFNRASDAFAKACGAVSEREIYFFEREEEARIEIVNEGDLPSDLPGQMTPNPRYWRVKIDGKATAQRYLSKEDAEKDGPRQRVLIDGVNAMISRSVARKKERER